MLNALAHHAPAREALAHQETKGQNNHRIKKKNTKPQTEVILVGAGAILFQPDSLSVFAGVCGAWVITEKVSSLA